MNIMNIHDIHEYLFQKMKIQKLNIHTNIQNKYLLEYSCILLNLYLNIQFIINTLMNIHYIELLLNIQENIPSESEYLFKYLFCVKSFNSVVLIHKYLWIFA